MGDGCYPSPPSIVSYSPLVEINLIPIYSKSPEFSINLDKNCNVTLIVGGVQIDYFPNVAVVSIPPFNVPSGAQPLQGFDDGFTGYKVQLIMQAVDGSGSVEWDWTLVVTQTSLTTPPALSNYPASIPDTLVNVTTPVELILNVDQPCVFTLTIDGEPYKTEANYLVTTPVQLTIDPTYLNDTDNIGVHIITISAVNSNGTSSVLSYTWNLVGLANSSLTTNYLPFLGGIYCLRFRPNNQSPWGGWQNGMVCDLNAAMNFAFTGILTEAEIVIFSQYQWKQLSSLSNQYAQPYIPPGGSKNNTVYHVKRLGPGSCPLEDQGHAMLAFYQPDPNNPGYQYWDNWQIFQYGVCPIEVGDPVCTITSDGQNQIPRPIISTDIVTVTISYIAGVSSGASGPTLIQGNSIVIFNINADGTVGPGQLL
jgi:hypothetical protein